MSKLIRCPACGREVSENAAACPGCAEPIRQQPAVKQGINLRDPVHIFGVVLAGVIALGVAVAVFAAVADSL